MKPKKFIRWHESPTMTPFECFSCFRLSRKKLFGRLFPLNHFSNRDPRKKKYKFNWFWASSWLGETHDGQIWIAPLSLLYVWHHFDKWQIVFIHHLPTHFSVSFGHFLNNLRYHSLLLNLYCLFYFTLYYFLMLTMGGWVVERVFALQLITTLCCFYISAICCWREKKFPMHNQYYCFTIDFNKKDILKNKKLVVEVIRWKVDFFFTLVAKVPW